MVADSEHVIVLRDQDSVTDFASRLQSARRVVLVGNGGIALELVHAMQGIEVREMLCLVHAGLHSDEHLHRAAQECSQTSATLTTACLPATAKLSSSRS